VSCVRSISLLLGLLLLQNGPSALPLNGWLASGLRLVAQYFVDDGIE
jgi:hypothetical protein